MCNLVKTLDGYKNLNNIKKLSEETERELTLEEEILQIAHVDHVDSKLNCILAILPSKHFLTGNILELIFFPNNLSKTLTTYEKIVSDLILKGKLFLS